MKIAIATLGCKVNHYDSAVMESALGSDGYRIIPVSSQADVYIINTCTVTEKTDAQSRQLIRRALKANPEACIIVTGCYAQHSPEAIAALSDRIHVLGNFEKKDISAYVKKLIAQKARVIIVSESDEQKIFNDALAPWIFNRTRAFLKIQDGCASRCAYCIVPSVRGSSRSLPIGEVIKRIGDLADSGYREIVLTGIHLGIYGMDLTPPAQLLNLLETVEATKHHPGVRIRLSSIEPTEISDELIAFLSRSTMVCPHLHIPLQSGDAAIIKKMNRSYTPTFFKGLIKQLVSRIPNINIGIDVIAGFPGETDEHFQNTVTLIQELPVGYLHVFPYSRRPGTHAARMSNQVPERIKKKRSILLLEKGINKKRQFYSSFINKILPVLIEGKRDRTTRLLKGFSNNYIPVLIPGPDELMGEVIMGRVTGVRDTAVYAEIA